MFIYRIISRFFWSNSARYFCPEKIPQRLRLRGVLLAQLALPRSQHRTIKQKVIVKYFSKCLRALVFLCEAHKKLPRILNVTKYEDHKISNFYWHTIWFKFPAFCVSMGNQVLGWLKPMMKFNLNSDLK